MSEQTEYERIGWSDVREGDVLMCKNGDRLTVTHVGEMFVGDVTGRNLTPNAWGESGFFPWSKRPDLSAVPTEPGAYHDRDGDTWLLDRNGTWWDWSRGDEPSMRLHPVTVFAPFTRLVPMPTRNAVADALKDVSEANNVYWWADAVLALFEGGNDRE